MEKTLMPVDKPATDTPTMAHTALRELVERAVDEARKLPGLGPTVSTTLQDDLTLSEQNYEDLLATAILNKVIEKFQNDRVDGNSNVLHRRPKSSNHESEMGLDEGVEEGDNSSETPSHDDRSSEENENRGIIRAIQESPLSLTIEEQIEEVTTTYTSDEELRCTKSNVLDFGNARRVPFPEFGMDIVDPSHESSEDSEDDGEGLAHVDRITPIESWEENWLFQKKKIQAQSEPVAMLVPNPSSEFRALIGDKDAEDTSDLSEFSAQSDDEADDEDLTVNLHKVIPKSTIIDDLPDSNGPSTTEDKLKENDVHNKPEINRRINEDHKIVEESSIDCIDFVKLENTNSEIPKTPTRSTMDSSSLSENIIRSEQRIDEEEIQKEISMLKVPMIFENKSVNTMEKFESSRMECLSSSTINGCLESDSGDVNGSLKDEVKSNGKAEDEEIIEDDLSSKDSISKCQALAQARADSALDKPSLRIKVNDDIQFSTPPRPGTIAEREHKKWENAAPIENNPYSEENIQKRLLERQYARRSSDVSGNSTKLQSSPSPPLQIVMGAGRPDFKRFGRDYYINEAKVSKGYSIEESGFFTATSRPNSSMSQHSLSIGSDYEHQERSRSVDTESTCSTSSESRSKLSTESQHDKVPMRRGSIPIEEEEDDDVTREMQNHISRNDARRQSLNDVSRDDDTWNGHHFIDEILESERKNNKNEINAKLNNRGIFEETQKPIKRLDLRAYGFENEINNEKIVEQPIRSKRVVSKLDLSFFGYDSGLRRTQSNNNIDTRVNRSPLYTRFGVRNVQRKSNLTQHNGRYSADPSLTSLNGSDDGSLTREPFVQERNTDCQKFGRIMAAKSVPNFGELYSRIDDNHRQGNYRGVAIEDIRNDRTSPVEGGDYNRLDDTSETKNNINNFDAENEENKKLPMPSVRRLAQAFNMTEVANPVATRKTSKAVNSSSRERPTTPEIHIIDSPRQMHSLTARSLSREFREGLRQIGNKQAPPLRPSVIPEQNCSAESPTNSMRSIEDVGVIAPGKLKNNIQFWEQLKTHS